MTVPIVSKKSLSMIAKMVRTAVTNPSFAKIWNGSWRPRPRVEKLGVATRLLRFTGWTPRIIAMIVVAKMLMISAARILSAYSTNVMTRPMMNTSCPAVVGNDSVTRVPSQKPRVDESGAQPDTIMPPLANPMNRMNRPMPTPIERFSEIGTAFMIASRRPITTRMVIARPSSTITPIAPAASRPFPVSENATIALMPRPAARANG